jgi:hypothetical protein
MEFAERVGGVRTLRKEMRKRITQRRSSAHRLAERRVEGKAKTEERKTRSEGRKEPTSRSGRDKFRSAATVRAWVAGIGGF